MLTMEQGTERTPERLVHQYFEGVRRGRVVDALDVFATGAVFRDEDGTVHRGIREIAAKFAKARRPRRVHILGLTQHADTVTAIVEFPRTTTEASGRFREEFRIVGGRVESLTATPVEGRLPGRVGPPRRKAPIASA
ncbi:MAG TPA: nuclear transport factor 2 family protein [Thermoplasmata archaeon]|nr:nuclear transport factor 2 family protein [Thermoplasmata archaeon]